MREYDARKKLYRSLGAFALAFIMILTNVLGVVEVHAADDIPAPTVNPVLIGATTISGDKIHKARVNKKLVIATVHVILKDKDGTVKADNLSVTPKSGTKWKVDLPEGVTVAKGDKVTVYQQLGEDKSPEVTSNAQPSKADSVTLTMPSGEIWIEQYVANIVNADEKAEASELLKAANPDIANDIKSIEFKITGVDSKTASYTVTYTDGSKTEEIKAPNLKIKQVIDYSRNATLDDITIVDNVVKGKLAGPGPFDGIKVQLIINVNKNKADKYCNENKCTVDKDSSDPIDVTLKDDGTFSYALKAGESLELDQIVGVSVKEPHKFKSCSTTTVKPVTPKKTEVKDPRKLTDEDKKAIDKAIREANTVNGVSKLPVGTGFNVQGVPAVIEFDKDGNVTIISPNDVEGSKVNGKWVFAKNDDGTYKVKAGSKVFKIPAKDLVKNIKPEKPAVKLSDDKKNITITPNLELDTDAKTIAVSYKDKDDKDQKITATKADDGTWSITEGEGSVDQNGVVTLPKNKVKGNTDVTATVTDKGGLEGDTDQLTSDPGTLTVKETKADKVEALGGLDPVVMKKWVKDTVNWKDGVKAKDSTKETEVNNLLAGATFTDETETKRTTDNSGDFEGKVKVKFDDDSEIIVEKQMLYVSDPVNPSNKENLPEDAIDVELKLGEGVKAGDKEGNKDNPVSAKTYKVKPGTDLSKEKVSGTDKTCFDEIGAAVTDDTYVDVVWNDKDKGTNFKATAENNVFTATATKKFKVTVQANGGTGDDKVEFKKSGETFTLPAKDTFTPPNENQEFSGWKIGDDTELKQPGYEVTVDGNKVISAIWKPIEFKVKFQTEAGASGEMKEQTVTKGSEYEIPAPTFTPEEGKEFAGWKIEGQDGLKKAKDRIENISGNVTLIATWKDIEYKVTFNGTEGSGSMPGKQVKKGEGYTLPDNGFEAPKDKVFDGWMVGTEKKSAGDTITVNGDTEVKAVWKDIEYKVTFNGTEGTGTMPEKQVKKGDKYTLPDNGFEAPKDKVFDGWMVGTEKKSAGDTITVNGDTEVKAVWKDIEYKVTFNGTEGTGTMPEKQVKKGDKYTLPENGFEAPKDKVFDGWMVGTEKKSAGDPITVNGDTEVKAVWKDIEYKVTFNGTEGTGTMPEKLVKKGDKYTLPENGFEAPKDKVFDGWMVGTEKKSAGDTITVNGDTEVKAVWKAKPVVPTPNPGGGEEPSPNPNPEQPQTIAAPKVTVDTKTGNLIITPPVGKDIKSVTVNYQDPTGAKKTAVAQKSSDGWSLVPAATNSEKVDSSTGVITIPKGKYKLEEVVKAFANNQVNQQSKEANATPVEVSYDVNGGSKGVESAITNKGESYVLPAIYKLPEYLLTVPQGKEFAGWEVDGQTMKAGESIKVNKNTVVKAIWKAKLVEPSKPDAPAVDRGDYLILEKVEPTEPKVDWEMGRHYKYLYGYPDGTVHPEGQITRAEAAGLIARLAELDLSNKEKPNFKDTPSRWYNSAINVMVEKNLMFGDKNGNFRPNEPITRGEFARALYYIDKKNNVVAPFADVKGHEFEAAINQAYGNGRIAGYPDGSFRPDAYIQRAEAARMLNQYADRSVSLEGMAGVKKDVIRFTDINESHWAYYEVMEAANTHDYRRAKGTLPETWVRIIQKDDRVAR